MTKKGKSDRAAVARMREAGLRRTARETLRKLREQIRAKKNERKEAVRAVRSSCRANLDEWRAKIKAARAEVRALVAQKREELGRCHLAPYTTRAAMDRAVDDAIKAWADERQLQAEIRRAEGRGRAPKITLAEKRRESDDEVRNNLTADLIPVWDAVKAKIKPSARMSRTEAFLQWAHDHSAEVHEIIAQHTDEEGERAWREMLAEEERIAGELKRKGGKHLERHAAADEGEGFGGEELAPAIAAPEGGAVEVTNDDEREMVLRIADEMRTGPEAPSSAEIEKHRDEMQPLAGRRITEGEARRTLELEKAKAHEKAKKQPARDAEERKQGETAARIELRRDRWTPEKARRYLENAEGGTPYAEGFAHVVRELAERAPTGKELASIAAERLGMKAPPRELVNIAGRVGATGGSVERVIDLWTAHLAAEKKAAEEKAAKKAAKKKAPRTPAAGTARGGTAADEESEDAWRARDEHARRREASRLAERELAAQPEEGWSETDRQFEITGPPPFTQSDDPAPTSFVGSAKTLREAKNRARDRSLWHAFSGQRFGVRRVGSRELLHEYRNGLEVNAAPF